jgi:murein DD-endopeptidase MepM/ murein hydrolase activator NlpD
MTYSITPHSATVDEGAGTVTFTITRSSATIAETLYLSTTPDQGFANDGDYTGLLNRVVSFAAGQSSQTITLAINDDGLFEGNESFGFILQQNASDPPDVFLAKSLFTIQDNDAPASYSITPGTVTVDEGAGTLTFTVTRSSGATAETVYVSTTPDQGFVNDHDYTGLLNLALSFAAGETTHTVTIGINDDSLLEAAEKFGIIVQRNASDPPNIYLDKSIFTIRDNDARSPVALSTYPATGIFDIGQGNRDNDDSHSPGGPRQWAYDFLTPNHTDVHAVGDGVVVTVRDDLTGPSRGYGNVITIRLDSGVYVTYGHLTAFSATVTAGMRITGGQILGQSGDSGSYDGSSLHPNLHIQFGSTASMLDAIFGDDGTATLIADGRGDAIAPAYFPRLVIDFAHRQDTGLSTDTNYRGTWGIDDFTGNSIGNCVFGDRGDDIIDGRGGNDVLRGGIGADILSGGGGRDVFVYNAPYERGDQILDFSPADDTFRFRGSAFASLPAGTLAASQFLAQGTNIAHDADDRFIFRTSDTTLWFDQDGNGAAAPIMIADLQAGAVMNNTDIVII